MRCDHVADDLWDVPDNLSGIDHLAAEHIGHCLHCQAAMAKGRRLQTELASLRHGSVRSPEGLLDEILDALDAAGRSRLWRGPACPVAWAIVLGLASVSGVAAIVVAIRVRRQRFAR